jgi:hypothetical protein
MLPPASPRCIPSCPPCISSLPGTAGTAAPRAAQHGPPPRPPPLAGWAHLQDRLSVPPRRCRRPPPPLPQHLHRRRRGRRVLATCREPDEWPMATSGDVRAESGDEWRRVAMLEGADTYIFKIADTGLIIGRRVLATWAVARVRVHLGQGRVPLTCLHTAISCVYAYMQPHPAHPHTATSCVYVGDLYTGYVYMCICVYLHMCICAYVHMCICVYVYMCKCVYVHMCICAYVYMCICAYV